MCLVRYRRRADGAIARDINRRRTAWGEFRKGLSFPDVFLPLYCILSQYWLGPVTIGNWILGAYALALIVKSPTKRFRFDGLLLLFLAYAIISQPLVMIFEGFVNKNVANVLLTMSCLVVIMGVLWDRIHLDKFTKCYEAMALIVTATVLVQSYQAFALGQQTPPIRIFPVSSDDNWAMTSNRPCSFFSEPQALVSWLAPLLFIEGVNGRYARMLGTSLVMLLSGSTMGVTVVCFAWVLFIAKGNSSIQVKFLLLIILAVLAVAYLNLPVFETGRDKLASSGTEKYSDYLRLQKAIDVYVALPLPNQIFGIGHAMLEPLLHNGYLDIGLSRQVIESGNYMSALFGVFVIYGLVGGILYWFAILGRISFKKDELASSMFALILISSIGTSIFFSGVEIFYLLIAYATTSSDIGWARVSVR